MTITGLPALVSLVVGQANEFDIVASTEFISSYFVIGRKTKRTFVKTASISVLKSRLSIWGRPFRSTLKAGTVERWNGGTEERRNGGMAEWRNGGK